MKKLILFTLLLFITTQAYSVAEKVIESNRLTFHNFSGGSYDVSGHILTIDQTQYAVNNLMVESGSINTSAGSYLVLSGMTIPVAKGSAALWAPGTTFPNPSPNNLIDFVQWGAAAQAYEAIAVTAGYWAAGDFVNSSLPINRSGNYGNWGSSEWSSGLDLKEASLGDFVNIGPNPFIDNLEFKFEQGHTFSEVNVYSILGKLILHKNVMQSTAIISLSTTDLSSGIYLIELKTSGGSSHIKKLAKH